MNAGEPGTTTCWSTKDSTQGHLCSGQALSKRCLLPCRVETGNPRSERGHRSFRRLVYPGEIEGSHYPEAATGSPHPGALCQPLFHTWRKATVNQEFISNLKYIVEHSIIAKRKSKTERYKPNKTNNSLLKKHMLNQLNRMAF